MHPSGGCGCVGVCGVGLVWGAVSGMAAGRCVVVQMSRWGRGGLWLVGGSRGVLQNPWCRFLGRGGVWRRVRGLAGCLRCTGGGGRPVMEVGGGVVVWVVGELWVVVVVFGVWLGAF